MLQWDLHITYNIVSVMLSMSMEENRKQDYTNIVSEDTDYHVRHSRYYNLLSEHSATRVQQLFIVNHPCILHII